MTEIYDFLCVFYVRLGVPHCPECGDPIQAQTSDEIIGRILNINWGEKANASLESKEVNK